MTVEGRRIGVRAWAYVWLATCVAVRLLAGGLLLAAASLVATPFLIAVFVLHAAILIPSHGGEACETQSRRDRLR